jgi:hypothetical protein
MSLQTNGDWRDVRKIGSRLRNKAITNTHLFLKNKIKIRNKILAMDGRSGRFPSDGSTQQVFFAFARSRSTKEQRGREEKKIKRKLY